MARIPTYVAQQGLDTGRVPDASVSLAVPRAIEGLGGSLMEAGARFQKMQEDRENFAAQQSYLQLQTRLGSEYEAGKSNMPENGAGWHDGWVGNVDKAGEEWLKTVPPRLQEEYRLRLQTAREAWGARAAGEERERTYGWYRTGLEKTQNDLLTGLQRDGAAALPGAQEEGERAIAASGLPEQEKAALRLKWRQAAQFAAVTTTPPEIRDRILFGGEADAKPDPEYADLTYGDRMKLSLAGQKEAAANEVQRRADEKAAYDARLNRLKLGIEDGSVGLGDIAIAKAEGWLNDGDDVHALVERITARDKDTLTAADALAKFRDPTYRFSGFDKDDGKRADLIYKTIGGEAGLTDGDPAAIMRLRAVVERTDTIPEKAVAAIKAGIYSRDPKLRDPAMSILDGLAQENIGAVERAFKPDDIDRVQTYQALASVLPPDELAARLDPTISPQEIKLRKEMEEEGRKIFNDKATAVDFDTIMDRAFDPGPLPWQSEPAAPIDSLTRAAIMDDAREVFAQRYAVIRDRGKALDQTVERIKRKYDATAAGDRPRVMQYPPEKYYPAVAGSHDWLGRQLKDYVQSQIPDAQQWGLIATKETGAAISAGDQPAYNVMVIDGSGAYRTIGDAKTGRPALVKFDYAKEQEQARSSFQKQRQDAGPPLQGQTPPFLPEERRKFEIERQRMLQDGAPQ